MMRKICVLAGWVLSALVLEGGPVARAQVDTLWLLSGQVTFGAGSLAALRLTTTPEWTGYNESLVVAGDAPTSWVVVNADTVAHVMVLDVAGWENVWVDALGEAAMTLPALGNATHRLRSGTPRGDALGAETMVQSGWNDHPHFVWNLNEWQPSRTWDMAINGNVNEAAPYVPRQFTINDRTYPLTLEDSTSYVTMAVGDTSYISVVNHGRMDQVLHFHGYHVRMLQSSQHANRVGWDKDTVPVKRGECVVVELVPTQPGEYPVHAHNLVAVTNAGFYPGGMITFLNVQP